MFPQHERNLPSFGIEFLEDHVFLQSAVSLQGSLKPSMALA